MNLRSFVPLLVTMAGLLLSCPVSAAAPVPSGDESSQSTDANPSANDNGQSTRSEPTAVKSDDQTAAADQPASDPASNSSWGFHWLGWDGIQFEVQESTAFKNPAFTNDSGPTKVLSQFSVERVKLSLNIGVQLDVDVAGYHNSGDAPDLGLEAEVRRFRLVTKGDFLFGLPFEYQIDLGYVPVSFVAEDMYLAMSKIPYLGRVKIGSFTPPMGFENTESFRWRTFMEMSSASMALAPGTSVGGQMNRTFMDERATLAVGVFSGAYTQGGDNTWTGLGRVASRATWLPVWDPGDDPNEPEGLVHLGLSFNQVLNSTDQIQYESRPEAGTAPYAIDTGVMDGKSVTTLGGEYVHLLNGTLFQSELFVSQVDLAEDMGSPFFWGGYAEFSWILTGERRIYDRQSGVFSGVIPRRNFQWAAVSDWDEFKNWKQASYAVSVRGSYTDLTSDGIEGGQMALVTGGLTAYLRDRIRLKLNLVYGNSWTDSESSTWAIAEFRFSIDLGD